MATIINNPPSNESSGGGGVTAIVVGVIVAVVLIFLFVVYGLPAMRGAKNVDDGGITVPTTIQVPDKIDVNINQ